MAAVRTVQIAVFAALLSSAQAASAGQYAITYQASEQCPAKSEFIGEVASRLPSWRHAEDSADRRFSIRLSVKGGQAVGEISLDAAEQPRVVRGDSCAAVVRALALILAVTLDPVAALATEPTPAVTPPPAPPPPLPPAPASRPSAPPSAGPSWGIGATGGVLFGPAPTALYGAALDTEIGSASRRFAARLAASRLITGRVDVGPGSAHFTLTRVRVGLCYRPVVDAVSVAACLAFGAGSLEADASPNNALERADRSQRFWAAAGADGLASVQIVGPLSLQLAAELSVPLSRRTYFFENPKETVHTVAPVAVGIRAGVVVVLP